MKKILALALTIAFTFVVAAPTTATAVPPPDIVATPECTESGVCPPSYTVEIVVPIEGGGVVVGTATCPLELELTAGYTGTYVIGHWFVEVEVGWAICFYGHCGGFIVDYVSITAGPN